MSDWEPVDPEGRVRRAAYHFGSAGRANCTAVGLGDGRLVLCSPPGGPDANALFDRVDALGEVVAVVAPNGFHRVGMPMAARRYANARLFAPEAAIGRVRKGVDATRAVRPLTELAATLPDGVEIFVPPHMKNPDTVLRVQTTLGPVWTLHDLILNLDVVSSNPVERWLLGTLGYQVGLRVNRFGCRWVLLRDKPAFSAWLLDELRRMPPAAFSPGHGPVVRDAAGLARLTLLAEEIGGL